MFVYISSLQPKSTSNYDKSKLNLKVNFPLANMILKLLIASLNLNEIKLNYDREESTGNYDLKVSSLCCH